jgi:Tfp pilus assembly PilM family ATPase/Tfp pilus assembly protein PilN
MIFSYRSIVGLDFTGNELRYVELLQGIKGLRIESWGIVDLSSGNTEIQTSKRDILVRKIRELIDSGRIKSKKAVVGISREQYFFRKISLPPVSSDKLKPIIENQVERMFPIRGDQLIYDYQEIGKGKNGEREVIIVGARSSDIEEVLATIQGTDLELLRIDMRDISICNLLKLKDGGLDKPVLLMDVDDNTVFLELVASGHPVACRSVNIEGEKINTDEIIGEIEKSIGFFREISRSEEKIDKLLLSGKESSMETIRAELDRFFNINSEHLMNEDIGLDIPSDFEVDKLTHALGLALSGYQVAVHDIDLLPVRVKTKRTKDEWIRTGVISLAVLLLTLAFSISSVWRNEARLEDIQNEIATIEGRVNAAREVKIEYEKLVNQITSLNKLQEGGPHWLDILENLSEAIPEDAWLTSLDMKKGEQLRISGHASSAAKLIPLLESSLYLKDVKFEAPTTTRDFGGEEVETFRITADINWSGEKDAETE